MEVLREREFQDGRMVLIFYGDGGHAVGVMAMVKCRNRPVNTSKV